MISNKTIFRKGLQIIAVSLLFSFGTFAQKISPNYDPVRVNQYFTKITKGVNSGERSLEIRKILEEMRIKYSYEPFTVKTPNGQTFMGWNIIAEINSPGATKTLMLGAHYDRVSKGVGAVDNASGSIAILSLLSSFKTDPLKNHNLKVSFWDLEEKGLLGARHFVKTYPERLPEIYINFDVFGYGDTLWLWEENPEAGFSKILVEESGSAKFGAIVSNKYPPSDHLAFAPTKTESFSFSLLNKEEISNLTKLLNGEKLKPEEFPSVIRIIHTENDDLKKIDAKALTKALPIIEKAIRKLDKN